MIRTIAAGLLVFACLLLSGTAHAHQFNISRARIVIEADRQIKVELGMKSSDVDRAAGVTISGPGKSTDAEALKTGATAIKAYVFSHTLVESRDGKLCRPGDLTVEPDGDGVKLTSLWDCKDVPDPLIYQSTVLMDRDAKASQTVLIGEGDDAPQQVLSGSKTSIDFSAAQPSIFSVIGNYIWLGVEHIATGYDHISFLIAIILWGRRLWPLVKVVTAFTLSHSVTLTLSALGVVSVPESITEPAIALTIVFVAALNFFSRDIGRRWIETFFFGFIHGFGFASALKETGLPAHARLPALASFNIGVEIGQITVIAIALPILLGLDRLLIGRATILGETPRNPVLVYSLSSVVILLGLYWFVGRTLLPGLPWTS